MEKELLKGDRMSGKKRKEELARKITELVDKLPLFPHNIDKLLTTAVKPIEDNQEMFRLIEGDPELSAELLQVARSYFGTVAEINTIEGAVNQVGLQALVQLIGISYARNAINEEFNALKYLNEYIDHSEDISISCRVLAEISGVPQDELEIYTIGGLIHDVGRLAIMVASNRTSAHVLGTLWDKMASVIHDEKVTFGTDHCEIGMRICQKWNFSSLIQEGVLRHHSPIYDSEFNFAGALIFVSHFLSVSDPSGEILTSLMASEVLNKLALTSSDFDKARGIYKSRALNNI
jgi:HD-like signal output (HDOD) protein